MTYLWKLKTIHTLTVTRRLKLLFNQFSCAHSLTRVFDENQRMKLNPLKFRCNFGKKVKIRRSAAVSSHNQIKVAARTTTVQRRLSRS